MGPLDKPRRYRPGHPVRETSSADTAAHATRAPHRREVAPNPLPQNGLPATIEAAPPAESDNIATDESTFLRLRQA
eukprot:3754182-Rhodomonas_salina.1